MKRHDALAPLSRAHHGFLILAQLLKSDTPNYKGLPTDVTGKLTHALEVYEQQLAPHIRFEEEELFPLVSGLHPDIDQLIYVLIDDHAEIDLHFSRMQGDTALSLGAEWMLDQLGTLIEQHVRLEEREFFELIQKHADEELLERIAQTHPQLNAS